MSEKSIVSGLQIRAARALLGITSPELSERSGVSRPTIQRLESVDGIPPSRGGTLERVKEALEAEGIEFIGNPITSPGVRLHAKKILPR